MQFSKISVSVTIIVLIFATCSAEEEKEKPCRGGSQNFRIKDVEFDIDNDSSYTDAERQKIKSEILKEFVIERFLPVEGEPTQVPPPTCFCPKVFGPVVCDSEGNSHNNICIFNCEQFRSTSTCRLTPRKVLIKVEQGLEKEACKLPEEIKASQ